VRRPTRAERTARARETIETGEREGGFRAAVIGIVWASVPTTTRVAWMRRAWRHTSGPYSTVRRALVGAVALEDGVAAATEILDSHTVRVQLRTFSVYGLEDPRSGLLRYVGSSHDPYHRLGQHIAEQRPSGKRDWLRAMHADGRGLPALRVFGTFATRPEAEAYEQKVIGLALAAGVRLLNVSTSTVGRKR